MARSPFLADFSRGIDGRQWNRQKETVVELERFFPKGNKSEDSRRVRGRIYAGLGLLALFSATDENMIFSTAITWPWQVFWKSSNLQSTSQGLGDKKWKWRGDDLAERGRENNFSDCDLRPQGEKKSISGSASNEQDNGRADKVNNNVVTAPQARRQLLLAIKTVQWPPINNICWVDNSRQISFSLW